MVKVAEGLPLYSVDGWSRYQRHNMRTILHGNNLTGIENIRARFVFVGLLNLLIDTPKGQEIASKITPNQIGRYFFWDETWPPLLASKAIDEIPQLSRFNPPSLPEIMGRKSGLRDQCYEYLRRYLQNDDR